MPLKKVCIVGGGVAGVTAARVLKKSPGIDLILYEASDSLGGVWASGYPKYAIQTPGNLYEFPDKCLSEPKDFKDGQAIKNYTEEYADEHDVKNIIRLSTKVTSIESTKTDGSTKWTVTTKCAEASRSEVFDFVILATGVYSPSHKHVPSIPGIEHFKGAVHHSEDTSSIPDRSGKRVAIVGFGKSAHDCAMNALAETGVPPTLLFRAAHWCVPRKVLGLVPMEWLLYSRFGQGTLPRWQSCGPVEWAVHTLMYPLIWLYWRVVQAILVVQLGLWGRSAHLRPSLRIEDDMYCGHGLICHPDMFPLMHEGKIRAAKGQIEKILPSGEVRLDDGSTLEADELVFATGFRRVLDFLPRELLDKREEDGFFCYRQMIAPGVPNLAFLNSNVTTFSNITTPGIQAAWLGELLRGNIALPGDMEAIVDGERRWRRANLGRAGGARAYLVQLHQIRYWDSLLCDMGINVKRKTSRLLGPVGASLKNFFAPINSSDYQGVVAGTWRNDPSEVRPIGYKPSFLREWVVLGLIVAPLALA